MKKVLFLFIFALCFCGCVDSEIREIKAENKSLKSKIEVLRNEIKSLNKELDGYKYDPEKLLAEANDYFNRNVYDLVEVVYNKMQKYHPNAPEKQKIELILKKIEIIRKEDAEKFEREKKIQQEKEEREKRIQEEKRLASVKKLKKNYDDVAGTTWYEQPYFEHNNNMNALSVYIGKSKYGSPWLRLKMSYRGENWIFFEKAYLSYDGNTREIEFDKYKNKKTDNSSGYVWEWIDVLVDEKLYSYLCDFANGKELKMRLSGKYTETRKLEKKEIMGLKDVLAAYKVLKDESK